MNQFLKETFTAIACFIALLYVLFSLGNGSFDMSAWSEGARGALAAFGALISGVITVIQLIRYF